MNLENYLREKMCSLGAESYQKFLAAEVIHYWREFVGEKISAKVKPVKLEGGILLVAVESSAYRDQLKFWSEEIIDAINEKCGEPLVKEIRPAQGFQVVKHVEPPPPEVGKPKLTPETMTLSPEEIRRCEERAQKVSDEKLRETVLQTLISHAKLQKFRLASGWHKCLKCDSLCEPTKILCPVCTIKEREAMVNALFKIFSEQPWLKAWEAQKILLEQMPHMKNECLLPTIESARSSLIQQAASKVRFGDETSPDVLKLVALKKRLPLEKLTPAIIHRALTDLRFNLAEQSKRFKSRK